MLDYRSVTYHHVTGDSLICGAISHRAGDTTLLPVLPMALGFSEKWMMDVSSIVATNKKNGITSIESWLFNRHPYNGLLYIIPM